MNERTAIQLDRKELDFMAHSLNGQSTDQWESKDNRKAHQAQWECSDSHCRSVKALRRQNQLHYALPIP